MLPHGMSMTRATAAKNTPLAARASPTATRMRAQKRVKLGFMAPPGVDSVATEYSGRLLGVSTDPEISRGPRPHPGSLARPGRSRRDDCGHRGDQGGCRAPRERLFCGFPG